MVEDPCLYLAHLRDPDKFLFEPNHAKKTRVAETHHFNVDLDQAFHFIADPDTAYHFNGNPDPTSKNITDPCVSGYATLQKKTRELTVPTDRTSC